jgi:hypothetical protein
MAEDKSTLLFRFLGDNEWTIGIIYIKFYVDLKRKYTYKIYMKYYLLNLKKIQIWWRWEISRLYQKQKLAQFESEGLHVKILYKNEQLIYIVTCTSIVRQRLGNTFPRNQRAQQ